MGFQGQGAKCSGLGQRLRNVNKNLFSAERAGQLIPYVLAHSDPVVMRMERQRLRHVFSLAFFIGSGFPALLVLVKHTFLARWPRPLHYSPLALKIFDAIRN